MDWAHLRTSSGVEELGRCTMRFLLELSALHSSGWTDFQQTPECLPCPSISFFTQSPLFNLTCSYGPNPGNHLSFLESDPGLALAWFPSHRTRETFLGQMLGLSSELTTRPVPLVFLVSSIPILEMLTPRTTATVGWLLSPRTHVSISLSFSPHPFIV